MTIHPSRDTLQKLGTLSQFASERAKQLDEEPIKTVDSTALGDVIEIRPIPQELPEIKPRLKAKKLELEE